MAVSIRVELFHREYLLVENGPFRYCSKIADRLWLWATHQEAEWLVVLQATGGPSDSFSITGIGWSVEEAMRMLEITIMKRIARVKELMNPSESESGNPSESEVEALVELIPKWFDFMIEFAVEGFVRSDILRPERQFAFKAKVKTELIKAIKAALEHEVMFERLDRGNTEN